jgi:hypothetical protein
LDSAWAGEGREVGAGALDAGMGPIIGGGHGRTAVAEPQPLPYVRMDPAAVPESQHGDLLIKKRVLFR